MAPVRRLRSLAWMNARRLPGVRCSTLNTECRSLLCLMTMPGRICVAGIAITMTPSSLWKNTARDAGFGGKNLILHVQTALWEIPGESIEREAYCLLPVRLKQNVSTRFRGFSHFCAYSSLSLRRLVGSAKYLNFLLYSCQPREHN